jgi:TM2 domain-containing membrane protein YozV
MMAHGLATPTETARKWSPGIAAVLSLVIPGAGQMYKGNVGGGLLWLVVVIAGYMAFVIPGLVLHLICIVTAASGDPTK